MFKKIGPQLAQHESGYSVFVADREHVGYRDAVIEVMIEADFLSGIVPLYYKTLKGKKGDAVFNSLTDPDMAQVIIRRIQEALTFLGITFELVQD